MINEMGSRLKKARISLGLNQSAFAKGLAIDRGPSTISEWERGVYEPGKEMLKKISQKYLISLYWLITGEGSMFEKSTPHIETQAPCVKHADQSHINIQDMLRKTGEILQSNTIYRTALTSNINAFHQSILVERDMKAMEAHMNILEQQMQKLTQRMDSHPPGEQPTDGMRMERLERKISELTQECDELKKVLGRSESEQDGSYPRTPLNDTDKASTSPDAEKR